MPITHLHFNGDCTAAIALYEKAFNTKVDEIVTDNDYARNSGDKPTTSSRIAHARMKIHGHTIMLNDRTDFANTNKSTSGATHLIVQFASVEELFMCYEIFKDSCTVVDPFVKTFYSEMVGNFMDKFGVMWGFMVGGG